MGKDKRGIERGRCMRCTCGEYVAHTSPENHNCGYCECAPMQHEELSSSTTAAQAHTQREMQHFKPESYTWAQAHIPSPAHYHQGNSRAVLDADQTMPSHPGQLNDNCRTQKKQSYNETGPISQEKLYARKYGSHEKDIDPNHLGIECTEGQRGSEYYGKAGDINSFQQTFGETFKDEENRFSKKPPENNDSGHGTSTKRSTSASAANKPFQRSLYRSMPYQSQNMPYGMYNMESNHRRRGHNGRPHGVLHGTKMYYNMQVHESHVHQQDHEQLQPSTSNEYDRRPPTPCLQQRQGRQEEFMYEKSIPYQPSDDHQGRSEGHNNLPLHGKTLHGERSGDICKQHHDSTLTDRSHSPQISGYYIYKPTTHLQRVVVGSEQQHDIHSQLDGSPSTYQKPVQQGEALAGSAQSCELSQSYSPHIPHTSSERDEDIVTIMKHLHEKLRKLEEEQTSVKRQLQNIISGVNLPESEIEASTELLHKQANLSDNLVTSPPTLKQPSMYMIPMTLSPRQNPLNLSNNVPSGSSLKQSLQPAAKPMVNYNSNTSRNNQSGLVDIKRQNSRDHDISSSQGSILVESSEQYLQQVARLEDSNSDDDRNKHSPPRQSLFDHHVDISEEQQGRSRPLPPPKDYPQALAKTSDPDSNKKLDENKQLLHDERNMTKDSEVESTSRQTSENKTEATGDSGPSLDSISDNASYQLPERDSTAEGEGSMQHAVHNSDQPLQKVVKLQDSDSDTVVTTLAMTGSGSHVNNLHVDDGHLTSELVPNSSQEIKQELPSSTSDSEMSTEEYFSASGSEMDMDDDDMHPSHVHAGAIGQEVLAQTDWKRSSPEVSMKRDEPVSSAEVSKKQLEDEPASSSEVSRKQDEPIPSSSEVSRKQDEPASSVLKKQDDQGSGVSKKQLEGEPASSSGVSSLDVSMGEDIKGSSALVSRKQDEPVSSAEVSRKQDEPVSSAEVSRKQDEPVSSAEVSRKQDEPVSSAEVSRKQDEPVSSAEVSRKQDEPVSSAEVSRKQDEPVSSAEVSRKQDEPVSSAEVSRKQNVPVSSSGVLSLDVSMGEGSSAQVSRGQPTAVSNPSGDKCVSVSKSEALQEQFLQFNSKNARQGLPVSSSEIDKKQGLLSSESKMEMEPNLHLAGLEKREQTDKTTQRSLIDHEESNPSRDIRIGPEARPGERNSLATNIPPGWEEKKEVTGKHVNTQLVRSRTHTRLKWKDEHDTFHPTVHGKNIKIESNGMTARRDQFFTDGMCFSQFPIKMGCNVHLKIVESRRFRGSMRIGFTSNNPEDVLAESLPAHSYPEVPEGFWIKPLHDKLAQQGYVVTYMVDSSGDVFYSINGEEKGLFFSGVDVSHDLWAAVDIHGSTIAVQFANDQVVSDAVNKNIHEGDQVILQVQTVETLQLLQEGHGGMQHDLEKTVGDTSIGVAIRIDDDEDVRVFFKKHNRVWCINPAALRKVGKVDVSVIIMEGDLVAIGTDIERIKTLQRDHGEWVETMERTLGKIGRVTKITQKGDLRLRVDGKTWTYNAKAVNKITMKKGVSGTSRQSGNCDKGLHYWKRGVAKVCTGCGECTANGADCGLQGSPFRSRGSPCGCREKTGGCADCGLCHTCAGEDKEETDHKQSKMARLLRMLKKHVGEETGSLLQRRRTTKPGEDDDSVDEKAQSIAVGDKVRVTTGAQTLPILQREGGLEWQEDMLQLIGLDGRATEVSAKSVTVQFPHNGRWSLVPWCLTKVHVRGKQKGAETYQRGELVRVIKDERQLKKLQKDHGGYNHDMAATLGKTGSVMRCKDGSVKVDVTGMSWWFHPAALFRTELKGRESLVGLHIRGGDIVRVDVDAETFKTNQVCHGGYVDRMEKSVEDFGVVHHIDIDGDAVVYYPDGTRWCINALSLGKVDPAECGQIDVSCVLEVADWVKVEEDKDRIKRVQEKTDCIRWQEGYYKTAGKVGQVRTTYPFNDVITVHIEGSGYPLNPKLLRRASPADLKEVFGSGDITNPGFTRGDLVKIAVDINRLRILQDGHGGFVDRMEELLDLVGSVSFIDRDGDVYVRFSIRRLCFNPYSLTKVTPEEDTFQVGDLLLIESDQERFKELQKPTKHGRYNPKMLPACGKVGRLLNVMDQDKVRVKVLGRTWVLNPQLVTRTGNPGLGTGDWKSATICAPNKHDWSTGRCLVCVKCGECTHYGRLCPARGKPGRYPGSLCGCGNGHAGCDDCGTCRGCAGEIQIHEDIESDGKDGWQGDAMEKLGVGEHQPTSSEKAAAHKVISAVLKKMSQAVELMKKRWTYTANIKTVLENDFLLPFTKYASSTHKKLMGDHLANINAAPVLLDQYLKCVPDEDIQGRVDLRNPQFDHECLQLLRKLLIHCTNSSFEFCRTVGRCNFLSTLLQDLSTFHKRTQNDTTGPAIHSLVTILYNCARVPENQEYFSSGNVVSILTPYLRNKDEGVRITTLSCLAFIVEDGNLHFIRLNVDMTELIVSLLKDALDSPDHITTRGGFQYPALQVTTIISVLVRNDENKQILVTNGVVDLLIKMIETGDDKEKESALLCVRKLADSDLISGIIRRETKVKKLLLPMKGDRKLSKVVRDAVAMTVDVLENGPPQETNVKGQGSISTIKCTDLLVDTKTPLGGGGFGVVFRGYHRRWMMNVAVKRLLPLPKDQNLRVIETLIEEANFMRCAQNAYRFIVPLYGVCVEKELTALVMDFMENGSVSDLMFRVKHVPWALRWRILHETILGMNFLHSLEPQIIHRDLKSQNILLDEDFHAKISDFGLSKHKHLASKSQGSTGCLVGTITHIPPENLENIDLEPGGKFDVYSFGILIWEVLTGKAPYGNAQHSAHIRQAVLIGQRPDRKAIPKVGPNELDFFKQLMEKCWQQFPSERPQFRELGEQVQGVMQRTNVQVAEAVHAVRTALGKEEKNPMERQLFAADAF
ncbi:uncharacterized protein LOC144921871 [Branchiostoma floridae x Branchiostoma belcheri]